MCSFIPFLAPSKTILFPSAAIQMWDFMACGRHPPVKGRRSRMRWASDDEHTRNFWFDFKSLGPVSPSGRFRAKAVDPMPQFAEHFPNIPGRTRDSSGVQTSLFSRGHAP
jgi:hypothetical protein